MQDLFQLAQSGAVTPASLGYYFPAEFAPQEAMWLSWPHKEESWPGKIETIYAPYSQFVAEVAQGQRVHINVADEAMKSQAIQHLQRAGVRMDRIFFYFFPTNDAWCRDHGPAFLINPTAALPKVLVKWNYNAWGEKYPPHDLDNQIPIHIAEELGIPRGSPVIVAGSTEPGEEILLRDALPDGVCMVIAPRKPEWWDGVAANLPGCVRRSRRERGGAETRYYLLDTIGELSMAYALADVVVMGRSFGRLYGSDPIEPASLGRPVVIGPRVADFRDVVAAFVEGGGIRQVQVQPDPARLLLHDVTLEELEKAAWFKDAFVDLNLSKANNPKKLAPPPEALFNLDEERSVQTIHNRNLARLPSAGQPLRKTGNRNVNLTLSDEDSASSSGDSRSRNATADGEDGSPASSEEVNGEQGATMGG